MQSKFLILVVDDDPLLAEILNKASQSSFPEVLFEHVYSANEAKTYFDNLAGYGPNLVLLDLNLEGQQTGYDVLSYLRSHSQARLLPVVILTQTQAPKAITDSYLLGASSFTNKPFSLDEWVNYLATLRFYWLETVTTPRILFASKDSIA